MIDIWLSRGPKTRRRWTGGACVAASLMLALTGCSGSDDDSSSTATATAAGGSGVAAVVNAANAFLGTLSGDEKKQAQLEFTKANATAWSNLPCGSSCRVGVQFGTLTDAQVAAGKKVLQAALGTSTGTGYDQAMKILLADEYLGSVQGSQGGAPGGGPSGAAGGPAGGVPGGGGPSGGPPGGIPSGAAPGGAIPSGAAPGGAMPSGAAPGGGGPGGAGSGYSNDSYFLAMLGTPSVTGTWQLHFGGHHLAVDLTYSAGKVAGASPFFIGVEPTSWTADGQTYAPLDIMRDGMVKLTGSLSSAQLAKAKLAKSYTDVLLGPGQDGQFPAKKEGLAVSELSEAQKTLVLNAIKPWVSVVDDATSTALMSTYKSELDKTYIAYSGGTGLTAHADYVRIDGPSVWVEFVCQNGIVIQGKIHYHTIYRDHTRDYGGELSF